MKKMFVLLFAMLLITLFQERQATAQLRTGLAFKIPEGIKPKFLREYIGRNSAKVVFIFQGNSSDDWTESLEIVSGEITGLQPNSSIMLYSSKISEIKKRCPGAKHFLISNTWNNSITYEVMIKNCPAMPDQYYVCKIIYTNMSFHTITYINKTYHITEKTRTEWRKTVSNAFLTPP